MQIDVIIKSGNDYGIAYVTLDNNNRFRKRSGTRLAFTYDGSVGLYASQLDAAMSLGQGKNREDI